MNEIIQGPIQLKDAVAYSSGSVVSKTLLDRKGIATLTLFAFDSGQGLSEHSAPFDALVQILDGEAEITLAGRPVTVKEGELLTMPANVPHALQAKERFKMLLTMVRG